MDCRCAGLNFEIIENLKGNNFLVEMSFPIIGKMREYFWGWGWEGRLSLGQGIVQGVSLKAYVLPSRSIGTL